MPFLTTLLTGMMFGLSAGFAPGPLTALIITQTLKHNVREGLLASVAPVITDMPIIIISLYLLKSLGDKGPILGIISATGGMYVLYLACETIRTRPFSAETSDIPPHSLTKGAMVNALNPHPYLFWITVGMPFILKARQQNPAMTGVFIVSFYCFLIGSKIFIALITSRFRTFMAGKVYLIMMRCLGILLVLFSLILFKDAVVYVFHGTGALPGL